MSDVHRELRVVLIGGSSHVGKSSLAESLASRLGWSHLSTDKLARHPGRPWRQKPQQVPDHVAEHYLSLSVDELIEDVLRHYKLNVWPLVESLVVSHATDVSTDRLIVEGSAVWPESVATLELGAVASIWLTADNSLFQTRIYDASRFDEASAREKAMIQKFLERTQVYNERMTNAVHRLGLPCMNVESSSSLDELTDVCLQRLQEVGLPDGPPVPSRHVREGQSGR